MDAAELASLPLNERLRVMEDLWDSICRDAGDRLASPDWHAAVVTERGRRLDAGTEPTSDWAVAKKRLRAATSND